MSDWVARLRNGPLRRGWLHAEADAVADGITLLLMAASVAALGSLLV
jgi:hypothetical protein